MWFNALLARFSRYTKVNLISCAAFEAAFRAAKPGSAHTCCLKVIRAIINYRGYALAANMRCLKVIRAIINYRGFALASNTRRLKVPQRSSQLSRFCSLSHDCLLLKNCCCCFKLIDYIMRRTKKCFTMRGFCHIIMITLLPAFKTCGIFDEGRARAGLSLARQELRSFFYCACIK